MHRPGPCTPVTTVWPMSADLLGPEWRATPAGSPLRSARNSASASSSLAKTRPSGTHTDVDRRQQRHRPRPPLTPGSGSRCRRPRPTPMKSPAPAWAAATSGRRGPPLRRHLQSHGHPFDPRVEPAQEAGQPRARGGAGVRHHDLASAACESFHKRGDRIRSSGCNERAGGGAASCGPPSRAPPGPESARAPVIGTRPASASAPPRAPGPPRAPAPSFDPLRRPHSIPSRQSSRKVRLLGFGSARSRSHAPSIGSARAIRVPPSRDPILAAAR